MRVETPTPNTAYRVSAGTDTRRSIKSTGLAHLANAELSFFCVFEYHLCDVNPVGSFHSNRRVYPEDKQPLTPTYRTKLDRHGHDPFSRCMSQAERPDAKRIKGQRAPPVRQTSFRPSPTLRDREKAVLAPCQWAAIPARLTLVSVTLSSGQEAVIFTEYRRCIGVFLGRPGRLDGPEEAHTRSCGQRLVAMSGKKKKGAWRWSMHPKLHDDVARLLEEEDLFLDFYNVDDTTSYVKQYDTNVMGRFVCHNKNCASNGWSSRKVPVTIRMYSGAQYNVRVYHQRCLQCNNLSRPILDDSYAERTAYRLKKWCGIHVETPHYFKKGKGPHHSDLCEGCKDGHCSELV